MNKFAVVVLSASLASCCPAKIEVNEKETKDYQEYCYLTKPPSCIIPFAVLAVNRTMFDGVEVSTSGYLFQSEDGYILAASKEMAFHGAPWDVISLFGNEESFSAHVGNYVFAKGMVRKGRMTWLEMEVWRPVSEQPLVLHGPIPPIPPLPPTSRSVPVD